VVFEFSSSEPGSSFECSLDGGPFSPCSSPDVIKAKKGKHHFEVRARDAAGNVDPAPAAASWKRKKPQH
jgi:large repetitive protein